MLHSKTEIGFPAKGPIKRRQAVYRKPGAYLLIFLDADRAANASDLIGEYRARLLVMEAGLFSCPEYLF